MMLGISKQLLGHMLGDTNAVDLLVQSRIRQRDHSVISLYEDLDDVRIEIRLLKLEASDPSSRLRGTLVKELLGHVNLREQFYDALSYKWGQSNYNQTIGINGHELRITDNLFSALTQLRLRKDPRYLWIDAICINQSDPKEKAKQIAVMRTIYARASTVIVWLGPSTTASKFGMKVIQHLASDRALIGEHTPWIIFSNLDVKAGLEDILLRGYWSRKWVIQENAVARRIKLQCGEESVEWGDEYRARRFLLRAKFTEISLEWKQAGLLSYDLKPILDHLELQIQIGFRGPEEEPRLGVTLLDLVHRFRHREVTKGEDALYALIGLAPTGVIRMFELDYNMGADQVFRKFLDEIRRENPQIEGSIDEAIPILKDKVEDQSMARF